MRLRGVTFLVLLVLLGVSLPQVWASGRENAASLRFWSAFSTGAWTLESDPGTTPRAPYWRAIAALQSADWTGALDSLGSLVTAGDPFANAIAAAAYRELGDFSAEVGALERSGNAEALLAAGARMRAAGDDTRAVEAYAAAWRLNPRETTNPYAAVLEALGRTAEAEQVYRAALAGAPPLERARPYWSRNLARLLMAEMRWSEAVEAWETVIETEDLFYPGDVRKAETYYELAWAYFQSGRAVQAVESIQAAIALDPKVNVHLRAAEIYEGSGQVDLARAAYRFVLAQDPSNAAALAGMERLGGEN